MAHKSINPPPPSKKSTLPHTEFWENLDDKPGSTFLSGLSSSLLENYKARYIIYTGVCCVFWVFMLVEYTVITFVLLCMYIHNLQYILYRYTLEISIYRKIYLKSIECIFCNTAPHSNFHIVKNNYDFASFFKIYSSLEIGTVEQG